MNGQTDEFAVVMLVHGVPEHIRSDNAPEMIAKNLRRWLERIGTRTMYITPGSPWENGYCESFNGKLRDELLNGDFSTRSEKRKSSSKDGASSPTRQDRTAHSVTDRQHRKPDNHYRNFNPLRKLRRLTPNLDQRIRAGQSHYFPTGLRNFHESGSFPLYEIRIFVTICGINVTYPLIIWSQSTCGLFSAVNRSH